MKIDEKELREIISNHGDDLESVLEDKYENCGITVEAPGEGILRFTVGDVVVYKYSTLLIEKKHKIQLEFEEDVEAARKVAFVKSEALFTDVERDIIKKYEFCYQQHAPFTKTSYGSTCGSRYYDFKCADFKIHVRYCRDTDELRPADEILKQLEEHKNIVVSPQFSQSGDIYEFYVYLY
jgi:hypothetical protein